MLCLECVLLAASSLLSKSPRATDISPGQAGAWAEEQRRLSSHGCSAYPRLLAVSADGIRDIALCSRHWACAWGEQGRGDAEDGMAMMATVLKRQQGNVLMREEGGSC